ncbi:hypothetical protein [Rhodopila globiformis]|uniref:Uncharacterized protein n=1 Tax=Rhodopila globiformis TaxID=1071 RepID=A0A2S6N107_RHOGL|nr:hypothetical protein [Rhodopila globiformis]PPQ28313.1 hypothetical protein CCS01_24725 [Rhodopila globiformis]
MRSLPWLEDFNTYLHPNTVAEAPPSPPDEPDPRIEAWTEGFLAGCRAARADAAGAGQDLAAALVTRITAIEQELAAIADRSAVTVGGMLIDILAAALPAGWPATRLAAISEAIRPIFELEPRLRLCPKQPGEMSFRDLPALQAALDSGDWDLATSWHQAAADIDPAALADRLRQPIGADADTVARSHHGEAGVPATADPAGLKVSSSPD